MKEQFIDGDGTTFHVKRTQDVEPILNRAAALRSNGLIGFGENRHVGSVPGVVLENWLKEAGVRWDDHNAVQDVIKRKLQDGEFSKLRVWEGRY